MMRSAPFFKYALLLIMILSGKGVLRAQSASTNPEVEAYIETWKDLCISHSQEYGIPASIKLAQAIIESRYGKSELATNGNNHFGIKCHKGWNGQEIYMDDDLPGECFRKYKDAGESFRDHSEFLTTRSRYDFLFSIDIKDYKAWAYGLKTAGYATNPEYANILIRLIEQYELYQYDAPQKAPPAVVTTQADQNLLEAYKQLFVYFAPGEGGRRVYLNNHLKCVFLEEGDDLFAIARDFGIQISRLMQYNDLKKVGSLKTGQVVYLQQKKRKAAQKVHVVGKDQTLWEISQVFGIRLKNLAKRNKIPEDFEPPAGKVLKLR